MIHEFQNLLAAYRATDFAQRRAALATVVWVQGSAYRRPGARMFISDEGRWTGAVSGGCLEGDALRQAREVMRSGAARLVTYDTTDDDAARAFGVGLGCQGVIDVLIEPLRPDDAQNPLELLDRLLASRQPTAMATVVAAEAPGSVGHRLILDGSGQKHSTLTPPAAADPLHALAQTALTTQRSTLETTGTWRVFTEVFIPDIQLVVFGAGYDVPPLAAQARLLGWPVTVTDDCVAHLSPRKFAACTTLLAPRAEAVAQLPLDTRTAAVLMSHNFDYDLAVLPALLASPVPYIGILGPKKRGEKLLEALGGLSASDQARIYSPIGLDLGAETPAEIALSVVAEIRAVFNQRSGQLLRQRNAPIH